MNKILDENYYDLIINNRFLPDTNNAAITELNEKHSIFHVNVQNQTLCDLGTHPYYSFPTLYTLSSEPVSYTHLDVYKRQGRNRSRASRQPFVRVSPPLTDHLEA